MSQLVRVIILNNCDQQVTPELTFTTGCELLHDTHYVEPEYPQIKNALLHYSDKPSSTVWMSVITTLTEQTSVKATYYYNFFPTTVLFQLVSLLVLLLE